MRFTSIALATAFMIAPIGAEAGDVYALDSAHTQVRVNWNHAGFSTQAIQFHEVQGEAKIDFDDPAKTTLSVTLPISGMDSGVPALNDHLNNADFFESDKHPTATFVSTSVEKTGDKTLKIIGDLTIKGITKPVTLDAVVNNSGEHPLGQFIEYYQGKWVGVTATGKILRSDWGLEFGAPITPDEVELFISSEMKSKS